MTSEDVSNAVMFARERELLTAVRGGGHSWPGKSVCDDRIMIESYLEAPRLAMFTHTLGGAAKGVGELDTAFPHRNAESMVGLGGGRMDPADDESGIAMSREGYYKLEPFMGGCYDNIEFDGAEAVGNYGPACGRLSKIKAQYDPGNLFRLNSNIEPAA